MTTRTLPALLATVLFSAITASAQTPVSTGVVQSIDKDKSTLMLRTDQQNVAPLTFHGMDKARIETMSGQPAKLTDLTEGMNITVHYATRGKLWYVSRVLIPDANSTNPAPAGTGNTTATTTIGSPAAAGGVAVGTAPATTVTGTTGAAAGSNAATDGDRTTRPGQGAAGDRTVQPPGVNAANDGDRTTQPGSTSTPVRGSGGGGAGSR